MKSKGLNGFACGQAPSQTASQTEAVKPDNRSFTPGLMLALENVPLYASATAAEPSAHKSGTYYIYDGIEINSRYRITNSAERAMKKPVANNVTGFVNKTDI